MAAAETDSRHKGRERRRRKGGGKREGCSIDGERARAESRGKYRKRARRGMWNELALATGAAPPRPPLPALPRQRHYKRFDLIGARAWKRTCGARRGREGGREGVPRRVSRLSRRGRCPGWTCAMHVSGAPDPNEESEPSLRARLLEDEGRMNPIDSS